MRQPISERRLAENQVMFRAFNESVQKGINNINKIAADEGAVPLNLDSSKPLHFYCECSDENCKKRIKLTPAAYNKIHEARDTFTIICGHEVADIEDVTATEKEYCVVKKHKQPPESAGGLNVTDIDNS